MDSPLARLVYLVMGSVPGSVVTRLRTVPKLAPLLERALSVASRPLHGQAVVIPHGEAAGLSFRMGPVSTVWASGKIESAVQRALARIIRPGDVFFDVGANVGFFTILGARLVGPSGSVAAFEPEPGNLAALRDNVELNGLSNVFVFAQAVSDSTGPRLLEIPTAATAGLVDDEPGSAAGRLPVVATSIDDFLSEHPNLVPDVVKIDVEGHEVEVIRGMRKTLLEHAPAIVCELHRTNRQLAAALAEVGYDADVLERSRAIEDAPWWAHVLASPRNPRR